MSSLPPLDAPAPRRSRAGLWLWLLLTLAAFVGGGLFTRWAVQSGYFLAERSGEQAQPRVVNFTPPQTLNATGAPPAIDPATLVTREAALAGQLTALEARTAAVATDAAAAGAQAARAEALMVAFAARRAIDQGTGLGYLEEQLRTRFAASQPRAVAIVIRASRAPVTIEDLRQGLDAIAPGLQSATSSGWWTDARRELRNLVVLRQEGTPSTAPTDRLQRARRLLDDGQVDAARNEVARLPGVAQAGAWMGAARRYALAHQALDVIETAAILGQAQPTQPPPVAAAPVASTPVADGATAAGAPTL